MLQTILLLVTLSQNVVEITERMLVSTVKSPKVNDKKLLSAELATTKERLSDPQILIGIKIFKTYIKKTFIDFLIWHHVV